MRRPWPTEAAAPNKKKRVNNKTKETSCSNVQGVFLFEVGQVIGVSQQFQ
jgi:hypothetical protein